MGKGWSEEPTDFFGNKYWVHYDSDGAKVGESKEREGFFGGTYIDHYDSSGRNVGRSEEREGFFGGKYTDHYDTSGKKVGTSEKRQGFFGGKYFEGQRDPQPFRAKRDERAPTSTIGSGDRPSYSQDHGPGSRRDLAGPSAQTTQGSSGSGGDKKGSSLGKKVLKGLGYAVAAAVVLGVLGAASEQDR